MGRWSSKGKVGVADEGDDGDEEAFEDESESGNTREGEEDRDAKNAVRDVGEGGEDKAFDEVDDSDDDRHIDPREGDGDGGRGISTGSSIGDNGAFGGGS